MVIRDLEIIYFVKISYSWSSNVSYMSSKRGLWTKFANQ